MIELGRMAPVEGGSGAGREGEGLQLHVELCTIVHILNAYHSHPCLFRC